MVYGMRTGISWSTGMLIGIIITLIIFPDDEISLHGSCPYDEIGLLEKETSNEQWEVIVKKIATTQSNTQSQNGKVICYVTKFFNYLVDH